MNSPGSGSGGCSTPTAIDGAIIYNPTDRVVQTCAGNVWRAMGPVGGAGSWASISAGNGHACGLKVGGTLWCWGSDSYGQLGNGATTGDQISPVQESTAATDWVSVSAGSSVTMPHTCAIKTNGTLWCWGSDAMGQLGNGATTGNQVSPVQELRAPPTGVRRHRPGAHLRGEN